MRNSLIHERSPYLRQHADNPVDWYPWGEAAFARARRENRPIFLSVGYSTCHWCHVMERESFADADTARLMNRLFVNIKVDREERPDVDRVYMTYVQATTGAGGWPMSVFLTPDLKPFHGGTYYPPVDRYRIPGFPRLLQAVAEAWERNGADIERQAAEHLRKLSTDHGGRRPAGAREPTLDRLVAAVEQARQHYDAEYGGFGDAPKFPRAPGLDLLAAACAVDSADPGMARDMLLHTLESMASGGMYDHLGGGFHRYSVDRYWHVPHYEKMLYDQAQLVSCYLDGHLLGGSAAFADIACHTLDYMIRDLSSTGGGFCAAEDADSLRDGDGHPREGAFYTWTRQEITAALGTDADLFCRAYGVEADGNSPPGSDPHGDLAGCNTLVRRHADAELAARFGIDATEVAEVLDRSRRALFELRRQRPRPARDDKVVTAWNGLAISALTRAARILERADYLDRAVAAAQFLRDACWDEESGRLCRSWLDGPAPAGAVAVDYACLVQGLLDTYEAGFDPTWLRWALRLQQRMNDLFLDSDDGGWFDTTDADPSILLRLKESYDGAEPAATSIAVRNCWRLAAITGDESLGRLAADAVAGIGRNPWVCAALTANLPALVEPATTVVVVGSPEAEDTRALCRALATSHLPFTCVVHLDDSEATAWLRNGRPHFGAMRPLQGRATAYVCSGTTCRPPLLEPRQLLRLLRPTRSHRPL